MSANSILAEMMAQVSGIADDKKKAGAGLTPVAAERRPTQEETGGQTLGPGAQRDWTAGYGVPNATPDAQGILPDDPDIIAGRIRSIRAELHAMLGSLDRLEALWVVPVSEVVTIAASPQEAFEADLAEKTARAQAEAFAPTPEPVLTPVPAGLWECPVHARHELLLKTSPKGRQYMKCTAAGCAEFER